MGSLVVPSSIEAKIPFGVKNGLMVQVSEVESGLACGAVCPVCDRPLQARKGQQRTHHFSHAPSDETKVCEGAFETSVHRMAKQILSEEGFSIIPELVIKEKMLDMNGNEHAEEATVEIEGTRSFEKVELEKRLESIRPDIIAYSDGSELLIEIAVTHFADSKKKKTIRDLGLNAIEIDLKSVIYTTTKEELRELLVGPKAKRKWLSNPKAIKAKEEVTKRLNEKVKNVNDSINKSRREAFDKIQHPKPRPKPAPLLASTFIGMRVTQERQYDPRWFVCESCRHIFDVPLREAPYTLQSIPCHACDNAVSTKTYRV